MALMSALALSPLLLSNTGPGAARAQSVVPPSTLPSLGDGADMSVAAERRLGDSIARDIYRDPDYLDDPVLGDYLMAVWRPLLGAARARGDVPPELAERLAWELMISRDKRVNAFALPGGYLGVNLGLLAVTDTPQELASVLAHELSHVSQRHIARMIARQDRGAPWLMGAMILAMLAARANTEVASAAMVGGQAVAAQTQLNFSRDMEREADRVGFGVLSGAGFDPTGFVTMFDKLQQAARHNDDGAFPYLRSHPLTSERIADMQARLPLAPSGPRVGPLAGSPVGAPGNALPAIGGLAWRPDAATAPVTTAWHALMSARARVLAESSPDRWRAWLQHGQRAGATPADLYAAALSAHRLRQHDQGLALAQRLAGLAGADTRWAADALLMELWLAPGAPRGPLAERVAALRDAALASGQRSGLMLGAQVAQATGALAPATQRLHDWVLGHPRDAQAWQVLAQLHQAQGQRLRALRAEGEARAAQLDFGSAAEHFKAAQALPAADRAADPMELAIVDARRREVEAQAREALRED
ncbi:M48 family metalloprotease [Hydrogenophaga sp.]|uniref:M48 family metalloprotease n=1 Tax=Hydrogenophaga sp. TaxID=1904254 RepID=UPI00286E578A|nr:M48 family metalloprotease [Hydrogenophaga sp.]